MPKYNYIGKTLQGEPRSGTLEAKNEHQLARILRREGCILISVEREELKKEKRKFTISISFLERVSLTEKIMFVRNLGVMVAAGVPLPRSLEILAKQGKNKKLKRILLDVREEVIKGKTFSDALGKYSNVFSELFISMVEVGEETGTMEDVLKVVVRQMEKGHEIRSRIKGAMVYPIVILLAMTCVGILMLILVVPKLSQVFTEMGVELPMTTRLVISLGTFLKRFWYTLPLIIIFLIVSFRAILKTKIGKLGFDTFILKIPIFSPIIKKTNSAHTIRTLSSLIAAGVPIVRSLEIVSNSLSNVNYKKAILQAAESVRKGGKLSEALKKYENIYPSLIIQMIEVGEETGETANILEKLADFFEEEVSNATKNLSAIVEPVLMLIIGAAVGFFAISMIQPIYSMLEVID